MASLNLTLREAELLYGVIAVMKADITWTEVAVKANFTNAKQARDKWPAVRDKIIACGTKKDEKSNNGGETTANGEATPKKAATTKKRKAAGESTRAKAKRLKKNAAATGADGGVETHVKSEADDEVVDFLS